MSTIPAGLFLADYPAPIRRGAARLRELVRRAVPDAIEGVRPGWRLIGYDVPAGRRTRYFAFVLPEPVHVHLGFEYGAWMLDPEGVLQGAHLRLRKVRFLTFSPGDPIDASLVLDLTREAARVALMTAGERLAHAMELGWAPVDEDGHAVRPHMQPPRSHRDPRA
jgi:hypothetical protein